MRIGGDADGAYLVPDDLEGVVACFSPGVNNAKAFEDQLVADFGIRSHLCDYTSDAHLFATPLIEGMQSFEKKWLDVTGSPDCIGLDEWVAGREPEGDLLLQMDIEGAEFRNLLGCRPETLRRFRIIVVEVHDVWGAAFPERWPEFERTFVPLMDRLHDEFVVVHAHPNNCCGEVLDPRSGLNLPGPLELTLLRRDRFAGVLESELIPVSLPHPGDIAFNVGDRAPLFLNEGWMDGPRSAASEVKMHEDQLDYLCREAERVVGEIKAEQGRLRTALGRVARLARGQAGVRKSRE